MSTDCEQRVPVIQGVHVKPHACVTRDVIRMLIRYLSVSGAAFYQNICMFLLNVIQSVR